MPRAIALLRVSTEGQAGPDRGGLDGQRAEVARVAERHGLTVVETVELQGVSGAAVLEDARFLAMLERLRDPDVDGIVVAEFSRLMRPEEPDDYRILGAFRRAGKMLWTPDGARDMREFGGRLVSVLQGELAAFEREQIRARTMRGKEALRLQGRHVEGPQTLPVGVAYDRETRTWSYRYPEAAQIREAFRRFLAGARSIRQVAAAVGLDSGTLNGNLRHPLYRGMKRWGRPGAEREMQVLDPPLVTEAEWWQVQEILAGRTRAPRGEGPPWLYRGRILCAECGKPCHAVQSARWGPQYRCKSSTTVGVGCPTGQLRQDVVDRAADDLLAEKVADVAWLSACLEATVGAGGASTAVPDAEVMQKRMEALRGERGRVLLAFEREWRSEAETRARLAQIDREAAALDRLAREEVTDAGAELEAAARALSGLFAGWWRRSWEERRAVVLATVRAVGLARAGRGRAAVPWIDLWWPGGHAPQPHLSRKVSVHGWLEIGTRASVRVYPAGETEG